MSITDRIYEIADKVIPPETVEFLNTLIINKPYMILNYWSIVHFLAGILFYKYISKDFKLWLKINIIFEVIEYTLGLGKHPLFFEEMADIVWDLILSLGGFKLAEKWRI